MDLNQFLHDRRARWDRLTALLDRVDSAGLAALTHEEVTELYGLYRLVSSDLNLVQTRTGNPALLEHLEALVGRAYGHLAVPRRSSFFRSWWRILRHEFPAAVRAEWRLMALSLAGLLAGVVFGFLATLVQPSNAEMFVGPEHLAQSPAQRVADLEERERKGNTRVSTVGGNAVFGSFLFTHNIKVSVLGFALGLSFGVGTAVMVFYNGAMLGSLAALYLNDGVMTFFLAWVGPHGVIELPCVVMACGAGFMLARAQFRRDQGSTRSQIRAIRPRLIYLLVGMSSLLVIAGMIEGGFSQVNEPTLPYPLKISVAVALFAALVAYLFWMPVRPAPAQGEDDETDFGAAAVGTAPDRARA